MFIKMIFHNILELPATGLKQFKRNTFEFLFWIILIMLFPPRKYMSSQIRKKSAFFFT